jgi:hypothetical protein
MAPGFIMHIEKNGTVTWIGKGREENREQYG